MQFDGAIPRTNGALSGERPGVPFRLSLRFRLSLIITLLIAAVLVAFLWAVNREVRRAVLENGGDRAMVAATQVADMLAQNTSRGFAELQRRAAEPGFSDFLASPSDTLRARLEQRLKPLAAPGQPPLAVLSADGTRLLDVRNERAAAGPATELPLVSGKPSHTGVGEFQVAAGIIYSDVVAEIRAPGDEARRSRGCRGLSGRAARHSGWAEPRDGGASHRQRRDTRHRQSVGHALDRFHAPDFRAAG